MSMTLAFPDTATEQRIEKIQQIILKITQSASEQDACLDFLVALEKMGYQGMISFLQMIDGVWYVVGDHKYSCGSKWFRIAERTRRSYEENVDLLPRVLRRRESRYIPDSRIDVENDRPLVAKHDIITQYVLPLATPTTAIGTLQVDLGDRNEKPVAECALLDILAAHLSVVIEAHRLQTKTSILEEEVANQAGPLLASASCDSVTLHRLRHEMKSFHEIQLKLALGNQTIRVNRDALKMLEQTDHWITEWRAAIDRSAQTVVSDVTVGVYFVEEKVQEILEPLWQRGRGVGAHLKGIYESSNAQAKFQPACLREILSCLVINSMQARARVIQVRVSRARASTEPTEVVLGPEVRTYVEIAVQDDGEGVPAEFRDKIQRFGWTSKGKSGSGIGLTVAHLLTRQMGGRLILRAAGKSSGQPHTEFVVLIPEWPGCNKGGL